MINDEDNSYMMLFITCEQENFIPQLTLGVQVAPPN